METINQRLAKAHISYNYCKICGSTPKTNTDEPNYAPLRFWSPDDGWIIGTLCRYCAEEHLDEQPKPTDYAYQTTSGVVDEEDTDEDPLEAL